MLNVLCAVRWALNGAEVDELAEPAGRARPRAVLVPQVTRMSADAAIVRAFFTAYGCCGVTDPIGRARPRSASSKEPDRRPHR